VVVAVLLALLGAAARAGEAPAEQLDDRGEFLLRMRETVTSFGFEEHVIMSPGLAPMPSEWERHLEYTRRPRLAGSDPGPVLHQRPEDVAEELYYGRFPDYLRVELMDLDVPGTPAGAVHSGRRALRMQLAGTRYSDAEHEKYDMVGVRRRVALEINSEHAYELKGWVRLEGVGNSDTFAQLWIEWLDAEGRLLARSDSDRVDLACIGRFQRQAGADAPPLWVPTPEFRINEVHEQARFARVWCVASGQEMQGYAYFDDLQLLRRPKVAVEAESNSRLMIFAHDEPAWLKLRFRGLDPEAVGGAVAFRRVIRTADFLGRRGPEFRQTFRRDGLRDNSIEERVRLDDLARPGVHALEIALEAVNPDGTWQEVAKRVTRLALMPPLARRGSAGAASATGAAERFALQLDLFDPAAASLCTAAKRCGVTSLAFPLWREDTDPARIRSVGGEKSPEELLEERLRGLLSERLMLSGMTAPVPAAVRRRYPEWQGARTLFKDDPASWDRLLRDTAGLFQLYLGEWLMADPSDPSFSAADAGRPAMAEKLRGALVGAVGKRVVLPLPLSGVTGPLEELGGTNFGETVFVAATLSPAEIAERLEKGFPAAAEAAGAASMTVRRPGMKSRGWFLELTPVGANLSLDMGGELGQTVNLARRITLLATAGAESFNVELADRLAARGDQRYGLLGPGLVPRPAYLAYCVLREQLSGAQYLGRFDLTPGSTAHAFERDGTGLVIFWADGPERAVPCQLGATGQVRLVALDGTGRQLAKARSAGEAGGLSNAEMVPLSPVPAVLTGMEPAFIRTRLGFRLADGPGLQTRYQQQEVSFLLRNYFGDEMQALLYPRFPPGFQSTPRFRELNIPKGGEATVSFLVRPSFVEPVGLKPVAVDLRLSSGNRRTLAFTLSRELTVESPIALESTWAFSDDGRRAEVQFQVSLSAEERFAYDEKLRPHGLRRGAEYDLEVSLSAPGGLRQKAQILGLRVGEARRLNSPFIVALGTAPRRVFGGAVQRGGAWFTNVELELPAARPPR
jgi:hypothetical protein